MATESKNDQIPLEQTILSCLHPDETRVSAELLFERVVPQYYEETGVDVKESQYNLALGKLVESGKVTEIALPPYETLKAPRMGYERNVE